MNTRIPTISVILPVFNAEKYIRSAIQSVLDQSFLNWELLIVNDGSTDDTKNIIESFDDVRIRVFNQGNNGVSSARNRGLAAMKGAYFCFLDADDVLPKRSLEVRLDRFLVNSELSFVDGVVSIRSEDMKLELSQYKPVIEGNVFSSLVRLTGECFFGPSWMIKREEGGTYTFQEGLTHGEDLCFYLSLAKHRNYGFVEEEILWYRKGHNSAMTNVVGLEKGYHFLYGYAKYLGASNVDLTYLKKRIRRIVFLSYMLDKKSPFKAIISLYKSIR